MKKSLFVLFFPLLLQGCGDIITPSKHTSTGSISGKVKVNKPGDSLIYLAIGKSLDKMAYGVHDKLVVLREQGPFRFDDVPPGTYRMAAFIDTNSDVRPNYLVEPYFVLESPLSISGSEKVRGVDVEGFFNERDPSFKTPEVVERYRALKAAAETAVEHAYQKLKAEGSGLLIEVMPTLRAMVFEAEMTWIAAGNESDWEHISALLEPVPELASAALKGENMLGTQRGCFLRAYLSEVDKSVQRYAVSVPEGYDGSRPFPLVIALHGAGGNHWSGMKLVTGCSNFLVGAEEANRHFFPRELPEDFIIACPSGHGWEGRGYREVGEYDVMKVLGEMRSHYNIDPARVYLTGASKGGRGAWEIGLKYPDLFASIAPVCGGTGMARAMAQNAEGLGIYVFHGAKDPTISVNESRVMVSLLQRLGMPVTYFEHPEWGHYDAWRVYRDGAIFDLFRN